MDKRTYKLYRALELIKTTNVKGHNGHANAVQYMKEKAEEGLRKYNEENPETLIRKARRLIGL